MTTTRQGRWLTRNEAREILMKEANLPEIAIEGWLLMNWPPGMTDVELRRMIKERARRRETAPPRPPSSRRRRTHPAPVEKNEPIDEPEMG